MKRVYLFAAGVLVCFPLFGQLAIPHPPGTFFTAEEIEQLKNPTIRTSDLVVLRDGTKLNGKVTKIPELQLLYGTLYFHRDDLAAVSIADAETAQKMQVITSEGLPYISRLPSERIELVQFFPCEETPSHTARQELELHAISYILFANKTGRPFVQTSSFYTLEFKNGDSIPVTIRDEAIRVTDSWNVQLVKTNAILHLNHDRGLYGSIQDAEGQPRQLELVLVQDESLKVEVAKTKKIINIPWELIASIRLPNLPLPKEQEPHSTIAMAESPSELSEDSALADPQPGSEEPLSSFPRRIRAHKVSEDPEARKFASMLFKDNMQLKRQLKRMQRFRERDLLEKDMLVSNLELELIRTSILRNAVADLIERWEALKGQNLHLNQEVADLKLESERRLDQKQAELEGQILASNELETQLKILTDRLGSEKNLHREACETLTAYMQEHAVQKGIMEKEAQGRLRCWENAYRRLEQENTELKGNLALLETEFYNESQAYEVQRQLLLDTIVLKSDELLLLQQVQEKERAENEEALAVLRAALDAETQKIEFLKTHLANLWNDVDLERTQSKALQSQVEELAIALEEAKHQLEESSVRVQELEMANDTLNRTLAEAYRTQHASQEEYNQRENDLLCEMEGLCLSEKDAQLTHARISLQLEALALHAEILARELKHATETMARQQIEIDAYKSNNEELMAEMAAEKRRSGALQNDWTRQQQELEAQKELVRKLSDSLNAQKAAFNKIQKTHLEAMSELENARVQHNLVLQAVPREPTQTGGARGIEVSQNPSRMHTVAEGENLNNISMKYYGTPYRWADIYEANSDAIQNVNKIRIGTVLVIPD